MESRQGGFASIGLGIEFGRKHFGTLLLLAVIQSALTSFIPPLLGIIGSFISIGLISQILMILTKITFLNEYRLAPENSKS